MPENEIIDSRPGALPVLDGTADPDRSRGLPAGGQPPGAATTPGTPFTPGHCTVGRWSGGSGPHQKKQRDHRSPAALQSGAMAIQSSFDVTSTIDFQEVDNALNQARKEVGQRYDFKGATADIELNTTDKTLTLTADDEFKMNQLWEIVQTRLVRRGVPTKNFKIEGSVPSAGGKVRRVIPIQQGIPIEAAREIVKFIKDKKLKKVQAAIQSDQVRISSPSKDELQAAMHYLREQDFGVALQFGNYR
jgi:cyclic-di-GMP-binding protein